MRRQIILLAAALIAAGGLIAGGQARTGEPELTEAELREIARLGPWPQPFEADPSNRVSGKPEAIELGRALFFDARLSSNGAVACASCHKPDAAWTDGQPVAVGITAADRNTISLFDVRLNRWHGWDGAGDSLWAQSIRPILDAREMGGSAERTARTIADDGKLARAYRVAFAAAPDPADTQAVLVNAGKALAAFQETIQSPRTPFDEFRDALAGGDASAPSRYPPAALRGLRIFVGRGSCTACHLGPRFTNDEFADIGIPFFTASKGVDPGRHGGITKLKASPYNLLGRYNDDLARSGAWTTAQVDQQHRNWGEFKVPSLRGVRHTAPYMHNGRLPTLQSVVRYYSELDESRLHVHGERILKPLGLTESEIADLVAFLETL